MLLNDRISLRVSFFGRLGDELTRAPVPPNRFDATLEELSQTAIKKEDGYFVLADVSATASDYTITISAPAYRKRSLTSSLPADTVVELAPPGEDELFVVVTNVPAADQIDFEEIPFLPTIEAGARVIGPSVPRTLTESLEGSKIKLAKLDDTAGITAGDLLRIVRSSRVLLRPGPYYPFPADTTLVAFKITADDLEATPLDEATVLIEEVNDVAVQPVNVAGVEIKKVDLGGPPPTPLLLGTLDAIQTVTNARGDALFHYPQQTPITKLALKISAAGYTTTTHIVNVAAGERVSETITLTPA